ncbi:restriction endonuclease [Streptomyces sp. NPDC001617]
MSAPATTRRTRKTPTRPARRQRLPRPGWSWLIAGIVILGAAKTWPLYTALVTALIVTAVILAVVRPRRLHPLIGRAAALANAISARRTHLPTRGHRTLTAFQNMQPYQFEKAIAALAREDHRVTHAEQVGQANDRGADVLVQLRDGRRILVQCKKYRHGNNVGSETIQTINGVYRDIHHCHAAVIVTTATFTASAVQTNALLPAPIRLIDGHALEQWANGGHAPW